MNINDVTYAVSVSNTKPDCLSALGLEHTTRNFKNLSTFLRRNEIDTSHFVGVKAADYVFSLQK